MKSSIQDWKERAEAVRTVCSAESGQLESGPCLLIGVSICGPASGASIVRINDGLGANAFKVFGFRILPETAHSEEFHPPVKFRQGLYLEIWGSVESVTVRYAPIKD